MLAASGLIIYSFGRIVGDLLPASMDGLRIKSVLLLIGCLHLYLLAQIACIVWMEVPVCEHDGNDAGNTMWALSTRKYTSSGRLHVVLPFSNVQYCEPYFSETLSTSPVKTGCADGMVVFHWRIGLLRVLGKHLSCEVRWINIILVFPC